MKFIIIGTFPDDNEFYEHTIIGARDLSQALLVMDRMYILLEDIDLTHITLTLVETETEGNKA